VADSCQALRAVSCVTCFRAGARTASAVVAATGIDRLHLPRDLRGGLTDHRSRRRRLKFDELLAQQIALRLAAQRCAPTRADAAIRQPHRDCWHRCRSG
jgi:hypothetical protein